MHVTQQLHLDVTGSLDKLLHKNTGAAKRGLAFTLCTFKSHGQLIFTVHHPHASATAAVSRLEHHGPAEFFGNSQAVRHTRNGLGTSSEDRHACLAGEFAGLSFVA